jgi:NAD(P)H-dependent FMN reductase
MSKLQVIVGSTRPGRAADVVVPWVVESAKAHGGFEVEVVDLRDWALPVFSEHFGTVGDVNDPTYSDPLIKSWNNKIREGDAYLVVTPEYNHSIPGVLKNAIDTIWLSYALRNKPVAVVGYSGAIGGGIRAIEHLAQVLVEAEAVPLRNSVVIPFVGAAFDEGGLPKDPAAAICLGIVLDDLAWWSKVLDRARAEGQLPPGVFRLAAAMHVGRDAS